MKIKKTNTKTNTFRNPLPGSTSLIQAPLHTPQQHMKDEGWGLWSMHNSFSLPLLSSHTFLLLQHGSFSLATVLQDKTALLTMDSSWAADNHFSVSWNTSSFSDVGIPSLVSHSFLSHSLSLSCVICPFLNVFSQQYHQLSRVTTSSTDWLSFGSLWVCCRGGWNWMELAGIGWNWLD